MILRLLRPNETFLQKVQALIIEMFTFFIDAELSVYETGMWTDMSILFIFFLFFDLPSFLREHPSFYLGSDARNDISRSNLLLSLISFKCSNFSLLTVITTEYAPAGLQYLSQHLLGVSSLSEDVTAATMALTTRLCTAIGEKLQQLQRNKRLVHESDRSVGLNSPPPHQSSYHSSNKTVPTVTDLELTNTTDTDPESARGLSTIRVLHPFLMDYFQWLRQHKNSLIKLCRIVEVVHCVHPSLRYYYSSLHPSCMCDMC